MPKYCGHVRADLASDYRRLAPKVNEALGDIVATSCFEEWMSLWRMKPRVLSAHVVGSSFSVGRLASSSLGGERR